MKSLRARLTLALAGAGALLVAALCAAAYLRARAMLTEQFDDGLRARAAALTALLDWHHDGDLEFDYRGEFMPEYERADGGFYFALWLEKDGRLVEQSHSLGGAALPQFGGGEVCALSLPNGTTVRAVGVTAPFAPDAEDAPEPSPSAGQHPGAVLVIAGATGTLEARLRRLAVEVSALGATGLLLLALIVRAVLRRGLAPLAQVSELAARLDAGHLQERFPASDMPAEVAPICTRLNDLLARLESAFARERRFSADVAHELRTPIAELLSLAGAGRSLVPAGGESAAFFTDAGAIAEQMNATVSALLLLARCESGTQPIAHMPVLLAPLLEELCARIAPHAAGLTINASCAADITLHTDGPLFERLLRLLLENALAYTPPGGYITITAAPGSLSLTNGPVDLTPADLPHLGERFWRKDPARTPGTHAGLGLALGMEITRLLRLTLTPALPPGGALTMTLRWGDAVSSGAAATGP